MVDGNKKYKKNTGYTRLNSIHRIELRFFVLSEK